MPLRVLMIDAATPPALPHPPSLLSHVNAALDAATTVAPVGPAVRVEERSVWQPGSWLIQRCWETLADLGAGAEALTVARLAETRHPLAFLHALHRLARQAPTESHVAVLIAAELDRLRRTLFRPIEPAEEAQMSERLLLVAATAAHVGDLPLACAALERLDQFHNPWERVFAHIELRTLLAESIAAIGAHPLTNSLITAAIRRFDDAGAQLIHDTAAAIAGLGDTASRGSMRLLMRCVETFQYATLTSLQSRRMAATTLARLGLVDEVLSQLSLIANVQDARREAGFSSLRDDTLVVRQVKRPAANADVDFQVYTLQQAIAAMPLRRLPRQKRIALADRLAALGVRSDGWTAAGAATALIELGALKYAVEVVEHIAANDPTRAEGMLSLVRGLLAAGERTQAATEAERALRWARARPDRNPERAITWGLADIYLEYGEPEQALRWLAQWREPTGWRHRLGTLWRRQLDDDTLRLGALRLRALLQQGGDGQGVQRLLNELSAWAPRLLDGEALVHFLLDSLLRPLLAAGKYRQAGALLPTLVRALNATSGNRHTAQVTAVAALLAHQVRLARLATDEAGENETGASNSEPNGAPPGQELTQMAQQFLADLWQADAQRGAWQTVHGLEGSLMLLWALEGPDSLVALARAAHQKGWLWPQ
ncbi:MAG: hypothetical protein DCC55_27815 [Chloroflexi bacterium]|nr:MAG: hypothetical protein DCC55_27815 [Chloroflexota bacterium]